MGPNYVLDKGFLVESNQTLNQFELVKLGTTNTSIQRCNTAGELVLGVCQEPTDPTKVSTGKVTVDVRILGISRCLAGGAITRFTPVTVDVNGRVVAAGAAGTRACGIALTPASANGDQVDVLLTPNVTV